MERMGRLFAPFTEVAAKNPYAWFPKVRSAAELATVTPDNRTVEQRLNGILDANSDYIKRARNEGMMVANRRGLQNSSIAAGAAQGAAIDRALPIAQQDADIAAQKITARNSPTRPDGKWSFTKVMKM